MAMRRENGARTKQEHNTAELEAMEASGVLDYR